MLVLGANALTAEKNASFVSRFGNSIKILSPGDVRSTTRSNPSDFDLEVMSRIRSSETRFRHSVKQGALAKRLGPMTAFGRHSHAQPFGNQPLRRIG